MSISSHPLLQFQVLFLAWLVCRDLLELRGDKWHSRIVVSPLFETIPDLEVTSIDNQIWERQ